MKWYWILSLFVVFFFIIKLCYDYTGQLLFNYIFSQDLILAPLLVIAYSALEGIREAYYFDLKSKYGSSSVNEHPLFVLQRGVFFIAIGKFLGWNTLSLIGLFPLIHDGVYYYYRHKLNNSIYADKFFSNPSSTSSAIIDLNFITRALVAIMCSVLYIHYL